jgi:hypothetical protein
MHLKYQVPWEIRSLFHPAKCVCRETSSGMIFYVYESCMYPKCRACPRVGGAAECKDVLRCIVVIYARVRLLVAYLILVSSIRGLELQDNPETTVG